MYKKKFVAAVAQISPVYPLNCEATIEKAGEYISEAAKEGAKLIIFPECFLPAYPNWSIDLNNPKEWANNLLELTNNSICADGAEINKFCTLARQHSIFIVLGFNERVKLYDGVLYNSLAFISAEGELLHVHRKLFPSNREKVFHRRGSGETLKVVDSGIGRIGGLICYEHLQPLLKYSLIAQGEQIHCASWPGWPNYKDGRTNKHVIDAASRAHALEGQNFVLVSSIYVPPQEAERAGFGNANWTYFGGSGIINPNGEYIVGPLYDCEDILYGEIDYDLITLRKTAIDTTGRDARWNIINLNLKGRSEHPIESMTKFQTKDKDELEREKLRSLEEISAKLQEISDGIETIKKT